ncbi:glycosyltransferase, partial [bacterium]|nr:glycosyltransferase [bacterium]
MQIGGVERSLVGLLEAMDPSKVEVHLFLYAHEGEFMPMIPSWVKLIPESRSYVALGLPLRQAIFSSRPWIGLARLWAKLVTNLGQKMTGQSGFFLSRSHKYAVPFLPKIPGEYDLAISFLMPHDIVWKNVTAKKKAGWIHTDYTSVETGVNLALEAPAWAAMDKIVAVSDEVAKSFIKVFPAQAAKVEVIENLLSPSFVQRQSLIGYPPVDVIKDPETLVLCSAGRYTHQKAFDLAALACRKLLDAGMKVRWYILGYGPDEPLLRKLI